MTKAVASASIDVTANITKLQKQLDRAEGRIKRMEGKARRSSRGIQRSFRDVSTVGRNVAIAAAGIGVAFAAAARQISDAGIKMQGFERAFRAATGSTEAGAAEMQFVRKEADRLGLSFEGAAGGYAKLSAAAKGTAIEGAQARDIFTAVSEASRVLSLSSEQTAGALTAIEQIISKGKVQAEELRGQLGERLPGAFQIAARAMNLTTAELDKMLELGQVTAEDMLPAFAEELRKTFGPEVPSAANDAQAAYNRFGNAIFDLQTAIASSGVLDALTSLAEYSTNAAREIGVFLTRVGLLKNASGIQKLEAEMADVNAELATATRQLNVMRGIVERQGPSEVISAKALREQEVEVRRLEFALTAVVKKRNALKFGETPSPVISKPEAISGNGGGVKDPEEVEATGAAIDLDALRAQEEQATQIRLEALRRRKEAEAALNAQFAAVELQNKALTDEQLLEAARQFASAKVIAQVEAERAAKGALDIPLTDEEKIEATREFNDRMIAEYERLASEQARASAKGAQAVADNAKREADAKLYFQGVMLGGAKQFFTKNKALSKAINAFEQREQLVKAWNATKTGMTKALEWGWPMGPIFAAAIGAMGAANIASMIGVGGGGGVGSVGGVGAGSAPRTPPPVDNTEPNEREGQAAVQIVFNGDMNGWDEYVQEKVVTSIRDAVKERDVILIDSESRNAQDLVGDI
jgi:tape measure domain-containing protein